MTRETLSHKHPRELNTQSKRVEQNVINAQSAADDAMGEITKEMTRSQLKMNETKELKLNIEKRSKECKIRKNTIESEITKRHSNDMVSDSYLSKNIR